MSTGITWHISLSNIFVSFLLLFSSDSSGFTKSFRTAVWLIYVAGARPIMSDSSSHWLCTTFVLPSTSAYFSSTFAPHLSFCSPCILRHPENANRFRNIRTRNSSLSISESRSFIPAVMIGCILRWCDMTDQSLMDCPAHRASFYILRRQPTALTAMAYVHRRTHFTSFTLARADPSQLQETGV